MKVIFLDIDGVMNTHALLVAGGIHTIDHGRCVILKRIIDATGATIVLSSTWRILESNRRRVTEALEEVGLRYADCTPDLWQEPRAGEIFSWLKTHGTVDKYAILDDTEEAGLQHGESFFKTSFYSGLTDEIADKVIAHLGPREQ